MGPVRHEGRPGEHRHIASARASLVEWFLDLGVGALVERLAAEIVG